MFSELCRVGRDTELRYTPNGKAVCNIALAYDIGFGDNKRTQWIDGALWEKRAEAMAQYLKKGTQVYVVMTDLEAEAYLKNGEAVGKLKGRVVEIKFAGPKPEPSAVTPAQSRPQPAQDDYDDSDVPF
jgi:single-strand DNA-binding protein